jgi:hypothetical protein
MTAITKLPGALLDDLTNFTFANANVTGNLSAANANLGNTVTANFIAGTLTTNAQPNITSVGTLGNLTVTTNAAIGNVKTDNLLYSNGNPWTFASNPAGSNTELQYNNAGVLGASANLVFNTSTKTLTVDKISANGAGLSSLSGANVSGAVANATYAVDAGTSQTAVSVAGANVTGQVNNAAIAGTVYTNAQPNITSIGNLTTLTVTGESNLGNIGNVKITGGSNGYILQTDGNGNLSWSSSAGTTVGDLYFDSFVANGTQTIFTLNQTPEAKKYISVYIDSTYQNDDAYSVSGNSVTFASAPYANSVIEIRTNNPGTITSASTSGTVTTNAQPNITSVGNLTSLTMSGNIIPSVSNTYSIGNSTNRFKDLYLEGNTIFLGNRSLSADDVLPFDLTISPEVLTINADGSGPGNDIHWLWTWTQSSLPYARTSITNQQQIQVPLYKQGTYQINNFANEIHGNLDQRHGLYLKWVDGAGLDNLVSWANNVGNVTHSHPNINSGANTTVQRLNISVPSTVTIPTLNLPSNVTYNVAANGSGAYSISGSGVGENRNIGPLYRGATYTFNLDTSLANHPFYITTDNGTGFVSGQYVGEYTTGITGSRGNGAPGANVLSFTVANNAPDVLFYQCGNHSPMRGAITIKNLAVETNINGNPVLYFQHAKEGHKTPVEIRPIPALVNQMCLVYDATTNQFVPQDMATYVENTPSFKNKIQEVAGTATLVAPDGVAVVPTVLVVEDVSYLPLVDNTDGDMAFDAYTNTLYVWESNAWRNTKPTSYANVTLTGNTTVSGNLTVAGKTVPTTKTFTLVQTGNITTPYTGVARCYPTGNVTISNVYASLGTASSTSFTFTIKKNGATVGNYTINSNAYRLTSQAANISLTASDYLTLDISAGTGASDLKVDLEYSV